MMRALDYKSEESIFLLMLYNLSMRILNASVTPFPVLAEVR